MSFTTELFEKVDLDRFGPGDRIQICPQSGEQHSVEDGVKARSKDGGKFHTVVLGESFYEAMGIDTPKKTKKKIAKKKAKKAS